MIHLTDQPIRKVKTTPITDNGQAASGTVRLWRNLKSNISLIFMGLPAILWLFIFAYLPMVGIIIAFKRFRAVDGLFGSQWIGFENFRFMFLAGDMLRAVKNTLIMNFLFIFVGLAVSLFLALLLYEIREDGITKFYPTIMLFPIFLSWVIISSIVYAFLGQDIGFVNSFLVKIGLEPIKWYMEPKYWRAILLIVSLWQGAGYGMVLYYSGMLGINPEMFEAAKVDGANWLQKVFYITIPLVSPLIIINLILAVGGMFRSNFLLFYAVPKNSSMLLPATDVIDTFVYRATIQGILGQGAAAGLLQSVVGLVLVLLANWIVRKIDSEKALS